MSCQPLRWEFWKYMKALRLRGKAWNHKRPLRVLRFRAKSTTSHTSQLPKRPHQHLFVPDQQDQVWSADFMSDVLYYGTRFRTFNVIDDHNREVLAIEIDTSLRASRIVRVPERLKQ